MSMRDSKEATLMKSLRFETARVRKSVFYESVCLSVVGRVRHNSR